MRKRCQELIFGTVGGFRFFAGMHLLGDGSEDRESDMAKGWIGTTEAYTFTGENGSTKLDVELTTAPEWASMFEDGWPKALEALKQLAEQ